MGRPKKNDAGKWAMHCHLAFIDMLKEAKDGKVTADDFYYQIRRHEIPPLDAKKNVGNLFQAFKHAGYLRLSRECVKSDRNDSKLIRVWYTTGKAL